ncbi:MAG TPA: carboxypeptidase-like regulatory domain-containing protein [Bryobacteraceae bacterium]|nr:carboxypeptidase-like regulatory domain-containing protein [Bryobacteraceae bacterium]
MKPYRSAKNLATAMLGVGLVYVCAAVSTSWAQVSNTGTVNVTVTDQGGGAVPGADLELKDLGTNDLRRAKTGSTGTYMFPNLLFGTYQLTVSAKGFQNQVFSSVQVQTGRITSIAATLQVGATTQTVTVVSSESPVVETESSALSNTIDTKQVVNLPMLGRNVMSLAFLVPGWANTGAGSSNGTWNNMPGGAVVSADFDGTPGISNRFRSGGFNYGTTVVQPRIEDVGEMTIQTAQLDLSGTGTSAMRISIVSRRGTNAFHGRLFEDFRNSVLQANSWSNNARGLQRGTLNLNDFGGNVGGPIIKNKLFFFFTYGQSIQPSTSSASARVLSPGAQQGLFSYTDSSGNLRTVDLMQIAGNAGFPSTVLPNIAGQLKTINSSIANGTLTPTSDPNLSNLNFQWNGRNTNYWPAIRGDYNISENFRINLSYSEQKNTNHNRYNEQFPGVDPVDKTSSGGDGKIAGFGVDWVIRPTLISQFHAGYMYQYSSFSPENLGLDLSQIYRQNWGYGASGNSAISLYGTAYPRTTISSFYPLLNATDSVTWQKGSHSFVFGGSWYREQDHYWNGVGGEPTYNFGINGQDPLSSVFTSALAGLSSTNLTNAENLYAELTGRVSSVSIQVGRPLDPATKQYKPYGAYNLNEIQQAAGFWAQDRWRISPTLTLNYGLRWDVVGDDHDVDGGYSTLPTLGDLWGPTPVGANFAPGVLGGVANPMFVAQKHSYKASPWNFSPAVAIAWNPQVSNGVLGKLMGGDKTVIRTGFSLRHYTEGAQNFWAFASNSGQFFFQQGSLSANPTPAAGNFVPGSLIFGDPLPPYLLSPDQYSTTVPAANLFARTSFWGMNPDIRQPYVEQWNFGIQRQLGQSTALEVRYVGNLSLHQWLGYNINEVNIFENGFLGEFKNAQNNLAINQAAGKGNTFANNGLPGQVALPIFAAAFGSATSNYSNGTYITNLNTGAAGSLANSLAGNATFFCNMVGTANFPACASRGVNAPGAGYPINFWQVNPFASGRSVNYLDAAGSSNYHALQVELRQRLSRGLEFNFNYTWAHSLGIAAENGIQGQGNNIYYTDRDFRMNYGPSLFDIRHVVHISGTYDLPFGKGRRFLSQNGLADRIFGGWTLGTIIALQTGTPASFSGGYDTANTNDAGVDFNGITTADFQDTVGVTKGGNPWVTTFNSKFIASNGAASATYLTPQTTPGVWGYRAYIYGPSWYNIDLSINKSIPIRESIKFTLQGQFLNILNHPTFGLGSLNIQSLSFGQSTGGPTQPRVVELRGNIEF